ncbi:aspartate aminotransferase family protein [Sphingomonas canadensis]|uniref:Aspartate aminotransferase family protein n=1 Tax=Sphingomonas canadensis TaxID=1219257 RepID=A0ABW3H7W4_9SPHN|nr:aspartate aminotransferase family protein [Sphingomonas canadensis]MCW3836220.1 aspartate aminotransferase family protein [Sphingomonas canadensis]
MTSHVLHRRLSGPPIPRAVSASGLIITDSDGREVIDASGGAAVSCLGHGHPRVVDAICRQAGKLAYAHNSFFTSEPAEELADLLVGHAPGNLATACFVAGGSEAMETALKLVRQYHLETGQPDRVHFIARRQSYHGNSLGALALSGNVARRAAYAPMLPRNFSHVSPADPVHGRLAGEDDAAMVARLAAELEAEFERVGPGRVAAFCAETVVGATAGALAAPAGYFAAIRRVCDRHGALLVLDEVMCGMGRTGTTHAWEQEAVTPDVQIVAKGLGGGYQPIGAVLAGARVAQAIANGSGSLMHGFTYMGHPLACAAALAVQRVIAEDRLLDNVGAMGSLLMRTLSDRFGGHPRVADIRGRGLLVAVELGIDGPGGVPFAPAAKVADRIKARAMELGLACYPGAGTIDGVNGDHVLLAPPYIAQADDIARIVERLGEAVDSVCREVVQLPAPC